jgi:hypothetical protein
LLLYDLPRPYRLYVFSLTFYPGTELRARQDRWAIRDDEQDIYRKNFAAGADVREPGIVGLHGSAALG